MLTPVLFPWLEWHLPGRHQFTFGGGGGGLCHGKMPPLKEHGMGRDPPQNPKCILAHFLPLEGVWLVRGGGGGGALHGDALLWRGLLGGGRGASVVTAQAGYKGRWPPLK